MFCSYCLLMKQQVKHWVIYFYIKKTYFGKAYIYYEKKMLPSRCVEQSSAIIKINLETQGCWLKWAAWCLRVVRHNSHNSIFHKNDSELLMRMYM